MKHNDNVHSNQPRPITKDNVLNEILKLKSNESTGVDNKIYMVLMQQLQAVFLFSEYR